LVGAEMVKQIEAVGGGLDERDLNCIAAVKSRAAYLIASLDRD
jgi:hypothetical protein